MITGAGRKPQGKHAAGAKPRRGDSAQRENAATPPPDGPASRPSPNGFEPRPDAFERRPGAYATRPGEYGTQPAGSPLAGSRSGSRGPLGDYPPRTRGLGSGADDAHGEPVAEASTVQFTAENEFGADTELGPLAELDAPDQPEKKNQGSKQKKFWRELAVIVIAATVLTLVVKAFVVQVYRIPSQSMENTLLVGDRVLVNKLVYHFRGIDRGDIIVFSGQNSWGPNAPAPSSNPVVRVTDDVLSAVGLHDEQTYYIKRVIGLPGDHVSCCNAEHQVTVNGVALNETSYTNPDINSQSATPFNVVVPPGRLWVMGDNRGDSSDSRYHQVMGYPGQGTIPVNEVVGRAFMVIWPPSQFTDLPIPNTFQQAALHSGAAGATVLQVGDPALQLGGKALAVVGALPTAGSAAAAGVVGAPLLLLRQRRRRSR